MRARVPVCYFPFITHEERTDVGRSGPPLLHVWMRVRGFHMGFGVTRRPRSSCHHLQALVGNGSLSTATNNPEASATLVFSISCLVTCTTWPKSQPQKDGEEVWGGGGSLQGERRGDSRHRSEMKEGAGVSCLDGTSPPQISEPLFSIRNM